MGIHRILRALGAYTIADEDISLYENKGESPGKGLEDGDLAHQEIVERFIKNLDAMSRLPETQRLFALTKMVEEHPGILDQVKTLNTQLHELDLVHGWTESKPQADR